MNEYDKNKLENEMKLPNEPKKNIAKYINPKGGDLDGTDYATLIETLENSGIDLDAPLDIPEDTDNMIEKIEKLRKYREY